MHLCSPNGSTEAAQTMVMGFFWLVEQLGILERTYLPGWDNKRRKSRIQMAVSGVDTKKHFYGRSNYRGRYFRVLSFSCCIQHQKVVLRFKFC